MGSKAGTVMVTLSMAHNVIHKIDAEYGAKINTCGTCTSSFWLNEGVKMSSQQVAC